MSNHLEISKKFIKVIPNTMSLIRSHIKEASESELSFPKFRILSHISRGLSTVGELAELQCVTQPAISKLVDSLVIDKFITRHECNTDRRVIELQLTKEGSKKYQKVRNSASKNFQPHLELLSDKELEKLEEALDFLDSFFEKVQERKS
jgi:DNA-binding MarR family transcriptional regulator